MVFACTVLLLYLALPAGRGQAKRMSMGLGDILAAATEAGVDEKGDEGRFLSQPCMLTMRACVR